MNFVGVTGAEGFVGSHLVELLLSMGYKVRAMVQYNSFGTVGWLSDRAGDENLEIVLGDVRDAESVRAFVRELDVVFHLAALIAIPYSFRAPSSYLETNVLGTQIVMQACLDMGVRRVIHTSTSEVYGSAQSVPQSELHPLVGQSPYAASKIGADQIAYSYFASYGLNVTTVRPFNQFGPRQSSRAIIPTLILQALRSKVIKVGTLESTRDFGFVKETVKGFEVIGRSESFGGEVFNLGSGVERPISEVAAQIGSLAGIEPEFLPESERMRPSSAEVWRLCSDNGKIMTHFPELHFLQKQPFIDYLMETFQWFRRHHKEYGVSAGQFQL